MNDMSLQPGNREIVDYRVWSLVRDISELLEMRLKPSFASHIEAQGADLETALTRLQLLCSHVRTVESANERCR